MGIYTVTHDKLRVSHVAFICAFLQVSGYLHLQVGTLLSYNYFFLPPIAHAQLHYLPCEATS